MLFGLHKDTDIMLLLKLLAQQLAFIGEGTCSLGVFFFICLLFFLFWFVFLCICFFFYVTHLSTKLTASTVKLHPLCLSNTRNGNMLV